MKIDFYFDPISPYAWLASTALPKIEQDRNVRFRFVPVLFAGLLNHHGQKGPAEVEAKRRYVIRDAMRIASKLKINFSGPPSHPFNPLKALRSCLAVPEEKRAQFASLLMKAAWEKGEDLTLDQTILSVARECQLEGNFLLQQTQNPEVKKQLIENTQQAIDQGIFGVPSFLVEGQIFWGYDRLDLLGDYLDQKIHVDESKFDQIIARPSSAKRE